MLCYAMLCHVAFRLCCVALLHVTLCNTLGKVELLYVVLRYVTLITIRYIWFSFRGSWWMMRIHRDIPDLSNTKVRGQIWPLDFFFFFWRCFIMTEISWWNLSQAFVPSGSRTKIWFQILRRRLCDPELSLIKNVDLSEVMMTVMVRVNGDRLRPDGHTWPCSGNQLIFSVWSCY